MNDSLLMVDCQFANTRASGGAGTYVKKLVDHLVQNELQLNFDLKIENASIDSREISIKAVKTRARDFAQTVLPRSTYDLLIALYRQTNVHKQILKNQQEIAKKSEYKTMIVHELTNYSVHNSIGRLKTFPNTKLLATFLDIQDHFYPDFFDDHELLQRRKNYSFLSHYCEHFIAISEHTKRTMVDILGIPPKMITVIYLASEESPPVEDLEFQRRISELGQYFIYPAKLWKHKNHRMLLKCLSRIKTDLHQHKTKFILTGGASSAEIKAMESQIREFDLEDCVVPMGFLTENHLKLLISHAHFLVFPSLFEGFGMPVIEAMQMSCPVISSTAGSLPEICKDAAIMFDPTNTEQLCEIMSGCLREEVDRENLIKKGLVNVERFSWDKCITETLGVYQGIFRGN